MIWLAAIAWVSMSNFFFTLRVWPKDTIGTKRADRYAVILLVSSVIAYIALTILSILMLYQ